MSSPKPNSLQEIYLCARENLYFDGLIKGDNSLGESISRTTSNISYEKSKNFISEESLESEEEELFSCNVINPIGLSTSAAFPNFGSEMTFEIGDMCELVIENSKTTKKKYHNIIASLARPVIEKSYTIIQWDHQNLPKVSLPQSAALFYNGIFPKFEIVESCNRLNLYLNARREDVSVGVPGRFLQVVIGQDFIDVGSVVGTLTYAFYLNETNTNEQLCIVPVLNMKREDLSCYGELKWLLELCQINCSSLIFIDEIDLSYYDMFGSLKLVLLNGHKLPIKQEATRGTVVEIFSCKEGGATYSGSENVTVSEDSSCCTLIAEKFALTSPEILSGKELSKLLLAGILLDTSNLKSPHCTIKDKYMAALLMNGAGRFGLNGFYQLLKYKINNMFDCRVVDILGKDFKKWERVGITDLRSLATNIGISYIGIPIGQLLALETCSTQEIQCFQNVEKLWLLFIVSSYHNSQNEFKQELLVASETVELMNNLLLFLHSNAPYLPLKVLPITGLKDEMKVFEIDEIVSKKTMEHLLKEFEALKG